jgi:DNA polymerase III subunit delta
MPPLLIAGENRYLVRREMQLLVNKFKQDEGDMNLAIIDGKNFNESEVITACETPPFLGNSRLIIVRDFDFKKSCDRFTEFLQNLPEYCQLVLSSQKPDARKKLFKAFKKFGEIKEFPLPKPAEFRQWLRKEIQQQDINFETRAIELLATFTLGDCQAAENEIAKLKNFADGKQITTTMVQQLTHQNLHTSVFNLTDAISEKRISIALDNLRDIVNRGENLIQIFFMIVRQFRILLNLKSLSGKNLVPADMAKKLKLHPFVVQNSLRQVRNFSEAELLNAHAQLLKIDTDMKTGVLSYSNNNPDEFVLALEKFIVRFAKC